MNLLKTFHLSLHSGEGLSGIGKIKKKWKGKAWMHHFSFGS